MLYLVASISDKAGAHQRLQGLGIKTTAEKNNRIQSIHSSLKIEANSLSFSEVQSVIDGHLVLGPQKEIQEVKNAYRAYEALSGLNPFEIKDLKKAYGIMTTGIEVESGTFRRGEEGVFDGDVCIFMAPPPPSSSQN